MLTLFGTKLQRLLKLACKKRYPNILKTATDLISLISNYLFNRVKAKKNIGLWNFNIGYMGIARK